MKKRNIYNYKRKIQVATRLIKFEITFETSSTTFLKNMLEKNVREDILVIFRQQRQESVHCLLLIRFKNDKTYRFTVSTQ